jgi:methanogenic corrinoid protein MtbC1
MVGHQKAMVVLAFGGTGSHSDMRTTAQMGEPCRRWLGQVREGIAQILPFARAEQEGWDAMSSPDGDRLHQMIRQGDLARAQEICLAHTKRSSDGMRSALYDLILPVVGKLETQWKAQEVEFPDVIAGFWTVRRLLDTLNATNTPVDFTGGSKGDCLIALPPNEEHSFGAQVVAEELRADGWNVRLELSGSADAVLEILSKTQLDAVGFAVGHDAALGGLADLIDMARAESVNPGLSVIVGGNIFDGPLSQYRFIGADRIARSANDAVTWLSGLNAAAPVALRN